MQAVASSPAPAAQPLHFAAEISTGVSSIGGGLIVAAIMLVAAIALLAWLRYRVRTTGPAATTPPRWQVSQRLRLGPASSATFVRSDSGEWMIVECRGQLVVTAVGPRDVDGDAA